MSEQTDLTDVVFCTIIGGILLVVVGFVAVYTNQCFKVEAVNDSGENHRVAVENAKRYANELNLNVSAIVCEPVSRAFSLHLRCSVATHGAANPFALMCPGKLSKYTDCVQGGVYK